MHCSEIGYSLKYVDVLLYKPAISRFTVVSREAKKKQHAHASTGLPDHYSELFTWMAALKFENTVTQPNIYTAASLIPRAQKQTYC